MKVTHSLLMVRLLSRQPGESLCNVFVYAMCSIYHITVYVVCMKFQCIHTKFYKFRYT